MTLHHIFVLEKSGLPVQSLCIDHSPSSCALGLLDESLTAGFISAIQSFGEQIGAETIHEVKSEHFNLIFGLPTDCLLIFEVAPTESAKKYERIMRKLREFLNFAYYEGFAINEANKEKFIARFRTFLDNFKETRMQEGEYLPGKAWRFRNFLSLLKERLHLG
ncbi:MAG: hypothetical protein ACFFCD_13070 [Promethearchaeota archaeon]